MGPGPVKSEDTRSAAARRRTAGPSRFLPKDRLRAPIQNPTPKKASPRGGLVFGRRYCVTVKTPPLTANPPLVLIWMCPVVTPVGTTAVTWVSEFTLKLTAFSQSKPTLVVWVRLFPVMVTGLPTGFATARRAMMSVGLESGENPIFPGCLDSVCGARVRMRESSELQANGRPL